MDIKIITTAAGIEQCWEVASLLRPHLKRDNWAAMILSMMEQERFSIAGIMDHDRCVAFAGYRIMTSLHSGNIMYIDDLCTLEEYRGRGLGTQLLNYVKALAVSGNMDAVVLDTDFSNNTAQKVYLRNGFKLAALHLACEV